MSDVAAEQDGVDRRYGIAPRLAPLMIVVLAILFLA